MSDNIENNKDIFKCSKCKCRYFTKDFGLNRLGERYKTCISCRNKRKLTRSDMDKKRSERAIKDEEFKCDDCGGCFGRKEHLKIHIKSNHNKIKDNDCPYDDCDFSSSRKGDLTKHQKYFCHKGDDSKSGSAGEKFIKYILKKLDTSYLFDKPFDNIRSITDKGDVRFDFILYYDTDITYFIEFDGKQHFEKNWLGRDGKFEILQANDKIKDEYCEKNNYPMLRIKYDTPFDNIEDIITDFIH